MALVAGDAGCTTGLAGRIYGNLMGDPANGFSSSPTAAQLSAVKAICHAVALGVVQEIQANAVATVSVSAGGLQTSAAAGSPTTAPGSTQTLTGTVG